MRQQKSYLKKHTCDSHCRAVRYDCGWRNSGNRRCREKVPDDISVVGFDGTVISRFYTPRITSMGQDINSIAKRSVELLMKHIHYTLGCEHDYAPHNLIEGESVRRV